MGGAQMDTTADRDGPPTAAGVLATIAAARRDLDAWAAHVRAYGDGREPGSAMAAERVAGVVTATLQQALCDTRAVARDARVDAYMSTI